ncbi:uncharacterized protein LOC131021380 isoform X2 [Salvia miltiorrhiza]|uniref:uncharacterized protein LOC131021363 isoform X2 n=1 Tax=Salvia miltiorrhiza TaxID=226208 RepID=UPI0025AD1366|nr:uncharacterized protein LOC131021363 isoform X2 [Salvia miltiorrhiza]XP_057806529.1 uncharacterized protein LOC131021380 isoform X2 [Salvia miltiorrhiza]
MYSATPPLLATTPAASKPLPPPGERTELLVVDAFSSLPSAALRRSPRFCLRHSPSGAFLYFSYLFQSIFLLLPYFSSLRRMQGIEVGATATTNRASSQTFERWRCSTVSLGCTSASVAAALSRSWKVRALSAVSATRRCWNDSGNIDIKFVRTFLRQIIYFSRLEGPTCSLQFISTPQSMQMQMLFTLIPPDGSKLTAAETNQEKLLVLPKVFVGSEWLMESMRVMEDEICYQAKECNYRHS